MSGPTQATPRFLGRPDEAYPGYVPGGTPGHTSHPGDFAGRAAPTRTRASRLWLIQALTGAALLVLLGVHLVAQHLLAPDGLRDYAAVIAYLRQPLALVAEIGLVIAVIVHACLGTRAALVDMIPGEVALRRVSVVIGAVGVLVTAYALWLTVMLVGTGG